MNINTGAQQDLHDLTARCNQKGCLQVWGGDALRTPYRKFTKVWHITPHKCPSNTKCKFQLVFSISVAMPSNPHGVVFPPLKSLIFIFIFCVRLWGTTKEAFVAYAIWLALEYHQIFIHQHATKAIETTTKHHTIMGIPSSSSSLEE